MLSPMALIYMLIALLAVALLAGWLQYSCSSRAYHKMRRARRRSKPPALNRGAKPD